MFARISVISVMTLISTSAFAYPCKDEVLKLAGVYGDNAAKVLRGASEKQLSEKDGLKIITEDRGILQIQKRSWKQGSKSIDGFTVIHKKPDGKMDREYNLENKNCSMSHTWFFSKSPQSRVFVTGKECYDIAAESARSDDEYKNEVERKEAHMNEFLMARFWSKNKLNKISVEEKDLLKDIRNNCRNSAVLGKLSKRTSPSGAAFSNSQEREFDRAKSAQ